MKSAAIVATVIGSAGAFAPSFNGAKSSALSAKSRALPFLESPPNCEGYVGNAGFDPFRFSDFVPVDLVLRVLPVPEALEGVTAATAHDASVEQGGLAQMFLWFGLLEIIDGIVIQQMLEGSGRAPGDFGVDI